MTSTLSQMRMNVLWEPTFAAGTQTALTSLEDTAVTVGKDMRGMAMSAQVRNVLTGRHYAA